MSDAWCETSDVCCLMSDVRHLISDVCCLVSNVWCHTSDIRCLMSDVWCHSSDICCLVFVLWCLLSDVRQLMFVVRRLTSDNNYQMSEVCCQTSDVCCLISDMTCQKISQIQPLLGMSRDEVFITFQNLQLTANIPYGLLNMNVEIKIFIDTDTKKLHCVRTIDDSAIKWNREIISVSSEPRRETFAWISCHTISLKPIRC